MILITTGATGTISESFSPYLSEHTRTAQQGTANNSHMGHCTHTAESTNVNIENIFRMRNNITCSTNCKYRTAATLYTQETWFVSGVIPCIKVKKYNHYNKCDQERSREDSKIYGLCNRNTAYVECTNRCDTSNNRVNWNLL
jgi:hypothetical protein